MKIVQFLNSTVLGILAVSIALLIACKSEKVEPDCTVSGPSLDLSEKTDASCGASDGSVLLVTSGGTGTLTFSLSGTKQEGELFEGLSAGKHVFTVADENGCTDTVSVSVGNVEGVEIASVDVQESGCKESNGAITITATDGTEPYLYKLGAGEFQSENTFSGLTAGTHTVVIKDNLDCEFTEEVEVLSGISFETHISSIMSNSCAVSGCHNGDTGLPDFRDLSVIQDKAGLIKTKTGNGTMPPQGSGSLTQEQKDRIACWVDDGALDN